jgi:hypothetical protein
MSRKLVEVDKNKDNLENDSQKRTSHRPAPAGMAVIRDRCNVEKEHGFLENFRQPPRCK